tara:strand:- start:929 stop:1177 length:249 start_codon:yes stop_codon:yes gene_type:complete
MNDRKVADLCLAARIKMMDEFVRVESNEVIEKLIKDFTEDFTSLFILKCLLFMTFIALLIAVFALILSRVKPPEQDSKRSKR